MQYAKVNPMSFLPNVPNRLTPSGWSGVPTALTCASRSLTKFRGSQGFLHNPDTGLCSPLLWLEGPSSQGALPVQAHDGDMYLVGGWSQGDLFQVGVKKGLT